MQTKYHALETRSKELLLSQSSAVSGASVALSGLGNRLELLVEQLIASYNISERDLEVSEFDVEMSTMVFVLSHLGMLKGGRMNGWKLWINNLLTFSFFCEGSDGRDNFEIVDWRLCSGSTFYPPSSTTHFTCLSLLSVFIH